LTATLVVGLDERPIERVPADLAVVGISSDDRPLRGGASRADWRLCGELWQLVRSRKLSGSLGQAALASSAGPLRSPLLLVLGLGHRAELGVAAWRALGADLVRRALDLHAERAALGLASDAAQLGPEGTRALFGGALAGAAERGAGLALTIAGEGSHARLSELRLLERLEQPAGARLRLLEASEKPADPHRTRSGAFAYDHSLRFK